MVTDGLFEVLKARQDAVRALGIYDSTTRVTSVDNEIADLLSRGELERVMQWVKAAGFAAQRVELGEWREIPAHDQAPIQ